MTKHNTYGHKLSFRSKRQLKRKLHKIHLEQLGWHKHWKNWRYKNTTLLILSIIIFMFLATTPQLREVIHLLGKTGYIGAFVVGIFYVSVFTAAPASVVLFNLANELNMVEIALLAGLGGMVGDYAIFRFTKDRVFHELEPLFQKVTTHRVTKLYYTPYFTWLTPILGMIFIASPGPDEIGVGILGLSKMKPWQFLLVTFMLNFVGILIVVLLARIY